MWSFAVLVLLVCSACDSPYEPGHLRDAPDAGPGEVRHGFTVVGEDLDLAATSDGVACLTCGTIFYFDGALRENRRLGVPLVGVGQLAVDGDVTYLLDIDYGLDPDFGDNGYRQRNFQLFALSNSGQERWRNDLGDGEAWTGDFAPVGFAGPHVGAATIAAGPGGVIVHGAPLTSLFEPVLGRIDWTTPTEPDDGAVPDASGGLFVAGHGPSDPSPQAVLRRLDGGGNSTWAATWTTTQVAPNTHGGVIHFTNAVRTADGGFLIAGTFSTATLDAGGPVAAGSGRPVGRRKLHQLRRLDRRHGRHPVGVPGRRPAGQRRPDRLPEGGRSRRWRRDLRHLLRLQ